MNRTGICSPNRLHGLLNGTTGPGHADLYAVLNRQDTLRLLWLVFCRRSFLRSPSLWARIDAIRVAPSEGSFGKRISLYLDVVEEFGEGYTKRLGKPRQCYGVQVQLAVFSSPNVAAGEASGFRQLRDAHSPLDSQFCHSLTDCDKKGLGGGWVECHDVWCSPSDGSLSPPPFEISRLGLRFNSALAPDGLGQAAFLRVAGLHTFHWSGLDEPKAREKKRISSANFAVVVCWWACRCACRLQKHS